jgi:hypothetical protein
MQAPRPPLYDSLKASSGRNRLAHAIHLQSRLCAAFIMEILSEGLFHHNFYVRSLFSCGRESEKCNFHLG